MRSFNFIFKGVDLLLKAFHFTLNLPSCISFFLLLFLKVWNLTEFFGYITFWLGKFCIKKLSNISPRFILVLIVSRNLSSVLCNCFGSIFCCLFTKLFSDEVGDVSEKSRFLEEVVGLEEFVNVVFDSPHGFIRLEMVWICEEGLLLSIWGLFPIIGL